MPRVRSKNQCSCCRKSSSSGERPSSSDPSYEPPSSSKDPSSDDPSSDDPSSSSSSGSTTIGKCCAINPQYVIESETFEESGQTGEGKARQWLFDKRGEYGKGYTYHGPIQLLGGGFFSAVICLGTKEGNDCECYTEQEDQQDLWICSEGVDESYCYNLGGVPGTGTLYPGEECSCTGSPGCRECTDEAPPLCETGCEECSCCWSDRENSGEPGTVCISSYVLYSYETIMKDFPEILDDSINNCSTNEDILNDPKAEWTAWHYFLEGVLEQGFTPRLVFYNAGTGVNNGNYWEDRLDENAELIQSCVIDIWADDEGPSEECNPGIFKQPGWKRDDDAPLIKGWKGTNKRPACVESEAIDGITCWDGARLQEIGGVGGADRGTLDCDVASQLGGSATWSPLEGDNAGGCSEFSCRPECDQNLLPESIPPGEGERNPVLTIYYDDNTGNGFSSSYYVQRGVTGPPGFVWPPGWPNAIGVGGTDWYWYEESLEIIKDEISDSGIYTATRFICKKWTLAVCNRETSQIEDMTPNCPKTIVLDCEGNPVELDACDWQWGTVFTNDMNTDDPEECQNITDQPELDFPTGETVPSCGQWAESAFPISLPEKEYPGCPDQFNTTEDRKEMNTKTKGGVGTELTKLLKFFGITATEKGCKCKSRAAKMDKNGVEWSSNNVEKICDWLQEESQKRKLPFLRTAARVIVLRAIRNARKAAEV